MTGFIIIKGYENLKYRGIDACGPDDKNVWNYVNQWNLTNPKHPIIIEKDSIIYKGKDLEGIKNYYSWLQTKDTSITYLLLFFSSKAQIETQNFLLTNFKFIGFDCAYIEDEYGESIMFSTIGNELNVNGDIFSESISVLNNYDLFNNIDDAKKYINYRHDKMILCEGNLETAFRELNLEIVKVFLYGI